MASITVRDLPDNTKDILRIHAAQSGVSLETYIRSLLKEAAQQDHAGNVNIVAMAQHYFGTAYGEDELPLPDRKSSRQGILFDQ